jgi:hypothetical protein
MFNTLLRAIEKTGDTMLAYQFQKDMMYEEMRQRAEHEKLVEEIVQRVLSRIKLTVDTTEIFAAIDGLNEKINSLGK